MTRRSDTAALLAKAEQQLQAIRKKYDSSLHEQTIAKEPAFVAAHSIHGEAGRFIMAQKNETQNEPKPIDATILFVDMVDSSMLSHVHEPPEYDALVTQFQETAAAVVSETVTDDQFEGCAPHIEISVRGDELSLIMGCMKGAREGTGPQCHPNRCARTALQVAIRLKRRWLLSKANRTRIDNGQPPLGVAIGIHAGPVVVKEHTRFEAGNIVLPARSEKKGTAEGYAINTAKRVETVSRSGRFSRIFLTRPIYNRTPADFRPAFVRVDAPELKGIPVAPIIYEAKGIGHFDDKCFPSSPEFAGDGLGYYERLVGTNPDEVWLLLDLAHWYFDKGDYEKAAGWYRAVLEADPSFAPAYLYLGRAHFRDYRMPEARAALERSLQLDQGQARANHFCAVCLRREALMSLYDGQRELARDLFKRSIESHQTACRIADLENMDYPWARNGLVWTVAQSYELEAHTGGSVRTREAPELVRPFDLDGAMAVIEGLLANPSWSVSELGKQHLLLHTKAVVLLQKKDFEAAMKTIEAALSALDARKNKRVGIGIPPDDKAYAEKRAELLFHRGKCKLLHDGEGSISSAVHDWRKAKNVLLLAWKRQEDQQRVLAGQYWMRSPVIMPDGSRKRVEDYLVSAVVAANPDGISQRLGHRNRQRNGKRGRGRS